MSTIKVPVNPTIQRALTHQGQDTNFTTRLIELIAKADDRNLYRLRCAFPVEVAAWETWMASRPEKVPTEVDIDTGTFGFFNPLE